MAQKAQGRGVVGAIGLPSWLPVLAAIPYTTFPEITLGPVGLRTFGLMVALGVVTGSMLAARWGERWGVPSDETISLATRMVVAGVIGARLTWVLTHLDAIDSPLDVIAVWEGGLQFSGGFITALIVGLPAYRRWARLTRWRMLDGSVLAVTVGAAIGRIGCYAVGEHLGGPTGFFLATRYDGGPTREGANPLRDGVPPLEVGQVIHNTSLYELISLTLLGALLWWLLHRRRASPGTAVGVFLVWYPVSRFTTDFLRAYDETVLGLTGAQWMCLAMVPAGIAVLAVVRPRLARVAAAEEAPLAAPREEAAPPPSDPSPSGSAEG
jgi:phosphatidylglycerol---prolipoprotein diacylglyceryl transferase